MAIGGLRQTQTEQSGGIVFKTKTTTTKNRLPRDYTNLSSVQSEASSCQRDEVSVWTYQEPLTNCSHLQDLLVDLQKLTPALGFF